MDVFSGGRSNWNMVTVNTDALRERLNRLYNTLRQQPKSIANFGRFDYLWDLKEMALLEGKSSVQIPDQWLDELEKTCGRNEMGRGH